MKSKKINNEQRKKSPFFRGRLKRTHPEKKRKTFLSFLFLKISKLNPLQCLKKGVSLLLRPLQVLGQKKSSFWKCNLDTVISIFSVLVSIFTCSIMYNIYNLQQKENNRLYQINTALNNGDMEFEKRHWEDACNQYHIADSLGSADRRGHIKFRDMAYETQNTSGQCHDFAIDCFNYANRLYYTFKIDSILQKCAETEK